MENILQGTRLPAPAAACGGALYNELPFGAAHIADGEVLRIDSLSAIGPDLQFDSEAGVVAANAAGVYLFIWMLLAAPVETGVDGVVALELENGFAEPVFPVSLAHSSGGGHFPIVGAHAAELWPGDRVVLRNRSGGALRLFSADGAQGHGFCASLTVVKIS